jgi:hypothetical protein
LFGGLGRGGQGQVAQLEMKDDDMTLNGTSGSAWTTRILGALLCSGVAAVHVIDQHGL